MFSAGLDTNSKNIVLNSLSNTKDRLHGGLFFEPRLMGLGLRQAQPPDGPRFGHEPGLMRLGLRQAQPPDGPRL